MAEAARMSWKKVGLYYLLATVFGAYFFLVEWRPPKKIGLAAPAPTAQESQFLAIARDNIHGLMLKRPNLTLTFRRDGQRWTVVEPAGLEVPSDLLTSFVENLTPTKQIIIIAKDPKDFTPFGLNPPNTSVVIQDKTGKDVATVSLGGTNPTSSSIYARIEPSPQVYLLGQSVSYYAQLVFEKVNGKQNE
ncbi:MAG: DUF4340 domain-containing protein [Deltaproteobacteria bacterium]|nr:DUF4340 domain-containing protein [Deltaproteobacteria bacterium]